jgi:hypothetical protein
VFLNTYGFNNVNTGILYWSSVADGSGNGYGVDMLNGLVGGGGVYGTAGVVLVRP